MFSSLLSSDVLQACSADVAKHCTHVVPGNGHVYACLRQLSLASQGPLLLIILVPAASALIDHPQAAFCMR
jgi:hypothetical protein